MPVPIAPSAVANVFYGVFRICLAYYGMLYICSKLPDVTMLPKLLVVQKYVQLGRGRIISKINVISKISLLRCYRNVTKSHLLTSASTTPRNEVIAGIAMTKSATRPKESRAIVLGAAWNQARVDTNHSCYYCCCCFSCAAVNAATAGGASPRRNLETKLQ